MRLVLGRDAGSIVFDLEMKHGVVGLLGAIERDGDGPAVVHGVDRIDQQIGDDLPEFS